MREAPSIKSVSLSGVTRHFAFFVCTSLPLGGGTSASPKRLTSFRSQGQLGTAQLLLCGQIRRRFWRQALGLRRLPGVPAFSPGLSLLRDLLPFLANGGHHLLLFLHWKGPGPFGSLASQHRGAPRRRLLLLLTQRPGSPATGGRAAVPPPAAAAAAAKTPPTCTKKKKQIRRRVWRARNRAGAALKFRSACAREKNPILSKLPRRPEKAAEGGPPDICLAQLAESIPGQAVAAASFFRLAMPKTQHSPPPFFFSSRVAGQAFPARQQRGEKEEGEPKKEGRSESKQAPGQA